MRERQGEGVRERGGVREGGCVWMSEDVWEREGESSGMCGTQRVVWNW